MIHRAPLHSFLLSLTALSLACSGNSDPVDAGMDAGVQMDAGETVDMGPAPDAGPPECTGGTYIETIAGTIQNQDGNPLEGAFAQMCLRTVDNFICLSPEMSDMRGRYTVAIPEEARCLRQVTLRSLVPGDPKVTSYCLVDIEGAGELLQIPGAITLFDTEAPTTLPPVGDDTQVRTVEFSDGVQIDIIPDSFFGDYTALSSAQIDPNDPSICFLPDNHGIQRMWGFYPEGNVIRGDMPVRIPNDLGLNAGETVPLYVLGGLSCELADETLLEEGDWHEYGVGTVSMDGTMIEGRIPCLNWFGIGTP